MDQLKAQIEVGVAKASDMDAYIAQMAKLESDIAACERGIALAEYNLKADLKIDQSKNIALDEHSERFIRYDDARIRSAIAESVEGCFAVSSNTTRLEILKEERAIMLLWDREGAMINQLQDNEISIKETEYAIISARNSEEAALWADYYALLNQEDAIEVERLNVKVAENNYNAAAAKLSLGLVTPLEEQTARIDLKNAEITLQTAINDYARMAEDFEVRLR
jgi:outer membrane protein TolC